IFMPPRETLQNPAYYRRPGPALRCARSKPKPARPAPLPLAGLANGRHVEAFDPQRRHDDAAEVVAPLARQRRDASADFGQPAEHADRALVEAEVVHRPGHFAVLDQV